MSTWRDCKRLLRTDPREAGCDEAMAVLDISLDLLAAGQDVASYPGAAHLSACGPCREDFAGLFIAVTDGERQKSGGAVMAGGSVDTAALSAGTAAAGDGSDLGGSLRNPASRSATSSGCGRHRVFIGDA